MSALEVLAAHGVETMIDAGRGYTPTPVVSHAILGYNRGRSSGLADGIVITPVAQSARRRRLQIQPAARRAGRRRCHRLDRVTGQRAPRRRHGRRSPDAVRARLPCVDDAPARFHDAVRGGSRGRHRHGRDSVRGREDRRGPARRRRTSLLGPDRGTLRPLDRRRQRRDRPDVPLHDDGLGRPDPDGLLVALRHGPARRDASSFRRRVRQRSRPRPPRHRHAVGRPDESQSLPGGRDLVPLRTPAALAGRCDGGEDDREQQHASIA